MFLRLQQKIAWVLSGIAVGAALGFAVEEWRSVNLPTAISASKSAVVEDRFIPVEGPFILHRDSYSVCYDGRTKFDRPAYRQRAVVEQCVGWMKESRRIGTRFEKLAVNFHGMLQLAMIRRYLKLLFSDRA